MHPLAVLASLALLLALAGPAAADDPAVDAGASGGASATRLHVVVLREGDFGRAVARVQRRLRITADGVFGSQTKRAVKRFQRRRHLEVDGIVGPQTRRALRLRAFRAREVRHRRHRRGGLRRLPRALRLIAECESGGNPRAVSSDGRYRGKYQFSRSTWRQLGGHGDPARAPERVQDRLALKLYRRSGASAWPACGRAARR
jgi:resuscitation-promoting factor RpfB